MFNLCPLQAALIDVLSTQRPDTVIPAGTLSAETLARLASRMDAFEVANNRISLRGGGGGAPGGEASYGGPSPFEEQQARTA